MEFKENNLTGKRNLQPIQYLEQKIRPCFLNFTERNIVPSKENKGSWQDVYETLTRTEYKKSVKKKNQKQ